MSMVWIIAKVKGLGMHVTGLLERKAEGIERMNQILTCMEGIKAWVKELEDAGGEGIRACARGLSGGFRSIFNKHPLLKMCNVMVSPVLPVLKTSAYGAYNVLPDVQSEGV